VNAPAGIITPVVAVELRYALEDLYARYARCLDTADFDAWPGFFTDPCRYTIQARENHDRGYPLALLDFESVGMLKDRVYGIVNTLYHQPYHQRHVIGPLIVARRGDGALDVEANYAIFRTKQNELSEVFNVGRYLDVVVEEAGTLKFREKRCVYDGALIPNSLIYPI
jgi:salicylate 5-hydroxylase small subunit